MKEWEKDMPLEVAAALCDRRDLPTAKTFSQLEKEDMQVVTPISEIKRMARVYSKRHKVSIRIDEREFKSHPFADSLEVRYKGKSVIYLHPILKYYTPEYIKGVIEHEIDHMKVEEKWEKEL